MKSLPRLGSGDVVRWQAAGWINVYMIAARSPPRLASLAAVIRR
jgi:hypothetical protein